MKRKLLAAAPTQQILGTIVFASLLLFAAAAAAQTTENGFLAKPKAILLAEWTDSSASFPPPVPSSRIVSRARIVNTQNDNLNPQTKTNLVGKQPMIKKFTERFASFNSTSIEKQVFALVNKQRLLQNLPLLEWDAKMFYLAREHSENMARFNFFSHQRRGGKTIAECSGEIGVTDWTAIGENLAFNQGAKDNAEFSVRSWMNSASHKKNLLDRKWLRSGIGVAQTSDGKFYITQIFRN